MFEIGERPPIPRPGEPVELPVLMSTTLRGKPLTIYLRGSWGGDMNATPNEVEINGHLVTNDELDRGWVVAGEWL